MSGEKFFKRVVANGVIAVVIFGIMALAFAPGAINAANRTNTGAYHRGNSGLGGVAIIFAVDGGSEYVRSSLDILDGADAKATFFVKGTWIERNEELFERIDEAGHTIGNHGFFGRDHRQLSEQQSREEMLTASNLIERILGDPPVLFLPPLGAINRTVTDTASAIGMNTIMWTHDTVDFRSGDFRINRIRAGDFILMHPVSGMPELLEEILGNLSARNLVVLTVYEML
ncbi:MAG: polysaccharide deacetylase family protein [Firmicutes bacterium]|nr:polysaccharide deacetylase family protein [Bacillota bacterium]